MRNTAGRTAIGVCALLGGGTALAGTTPVAATSRTVTVTISGGHATDARDNGRPVNLVAGGLGVPSTVFRRAFNGVSPAPAGSEPDPEQVRRNKQALLDVLAPYGVTNADLDRVSDHYRYVRSAGQQWPQAAAVAKAVIRNGRVVSVRLVKGGAGYSTVPKITVPGYPAARVRAHVAFGKDLAANGRISSLGLT